MTLRGFLWAAAFAGLSGGSLGAATISGTFNISGEIIASQQTIDWESGTSPFPAMIATIGPGATGSFAGLDGTTVTIQDLDRTTEPVGSTFGPDLFITFTAAPTLPSLDINMIYAGLYPASGCTATPPAPGQTCTPGPPITPAASPFNFVNNPPPSAPQATATFALSGTVETSTSTWNANFTSQFTVPFQTILAELAGTGSVSNTYSASFTVTAPTATPESGTLPMLGLGMGLVLLSRSRGLLSRKRRQS